MIHIETKSKAIFTFLVLFLLTGCEVRYQPINYGEDKCAFCHMSIVDQRFGGEIVTKKGKIFKFDAVECMINYIDENIADESSLSFVLTNAIDAPGKLIEARGCSYLMSKNMPSPMGMFLNPFNNDEEALKSKEQNGGQIFTWSELRAEFS